MVISVGSTLINHKQAASISTQSTQPAAKTIASTTTHVTENIEGVSSLSLLAQQLSESARRAEARDSGLSRQELGARAVQLFGRITGDGYHASKAKNDAEVPSTRNPEHLARAWKATLFENGSGTNPFAGLSRDQLAVITYNDSGTFTVNEKRAASSEASRQEEVWRQTVIAKAGAEYDATGKLTQFFTDVLDHYKTLPDIEQAQYPASYETKLQEWIDPDFNHWTHTAEGHGSLQSVLNNIFDRSAFSEGPHGADSTQSD